MSVIAKAPMRHAPRKHSLPEMIVPGYHRVVHRGTRWLPADSRAGDPAFRLRSMRATSRSRCWRRGKAMELDPVLLARLQFAFTISFHIIFRASPSGSPPMWRPWSAVGMDRRGPLQTALRLLDEDLRRLVRHGRGHRHRPVLRARHQLEPVLGRRRQHHRAARRLRSTVRVLSRSDLPRHPAVRRRPGAAAGARLLRHRGRGRHAGVGILDPRRQQLDAHAGRPCDPAASPIRPIGSPSSSTRASPIASRTWSMRASSPPRSS